jgi:hypothetical protein
MFGPSPGDGMPGTGVPTLPGGNMGGFFQMIRQNPFLFFLLMHDGTF